MSPYIFFLCVERLSHLIYMELTGGSWIGIKLYRNGHVLSHLFFANDMVLFTEASMDQMRVVINCLYTCYELLGYFLCFFRSES